MQQTISCGNRKLNTTQVEESESKLCMSKSTKLCEGLVKLTSVEKQNQKRTDTRKIEYSFEQNIIA